MSRKYVCTFFETYFKKFAWQFKTETSAAVFYNSNTRCIKQLHQETSNSEVELVQFGLGKWTDFEAI